VLRQHDAPPRVSVFPAQGRAKSAVPTLTSFYASRARRACLLRDIPNQSSQGNGSSIAEVVWKALELPGDANVVADGVADLDNLILDAAGRGGDRPIGLIDPGGGHYDFKPRTLLLDYERALASANYDHGIRNFVFRDVLADGVTASSLAGDCVLWLKVEKLNALWD